MRIAIFLGFFSVYARADYNKQNIHPDVLNAIENGEWIQQGIVASRPAFDLAIQGKGFFVLTDGHQNYFSRHGEFMLDADGYVRQKITNFKLMYFNDSKLIPIRPYLSKPFQDSQSADSSVQKIELISQISVDLDGNFSVKYTDQSLYILGRVAIAEFPSPRDLKRTGQHAFIPTAKSGNPKIGFSSSNTSGQIFDNALEINNEDSYKINLNL